MLRSLLTILAGLAGLFPVPTNAADLADPRIAAFQAACIPARRDPDARLKLVAAEGWLPVEEDDHPDLAATMAASRRELVKDPDPTMTASVALFGREVAGRRSHLVLTRVASPLVTLLGCYFYDFDADAPVDPRRISDWLAEKPAERIERPAEIVAQMWNAERFDGVLDLRQAFLPAGSPYTERTGFSGPSLTMTSSQAVASSQAK